MQKHAGNVAVRQELAGVAMVLLPQGGEVFAAK
jgi:hypothetical protein